MKDEHKPWTTESSLGPLSSPMKPESKLTQLHTNLVPCKQCVLC